MPMEIAKKLKNGVFDGVAEVAELKKSPLLQASAARL